MAKSYAATDKVPPFGLEGQRRYGFKASQKSQVYDAIRKAGNNGLTRHQVSSAVGLAPDRISFYLSDLRRAGFIAIKGDPTVVSIDMNAEQAAMAALLGLENAFVAKLREHPSLQTSPELTKGYLKFNKLKELALRPGTGPEGKVALRMAILEMVKLIY